jgi:hypothetical protein
VSASDIECPFCNEQDFDAVGLKLHLTAGHCDAYEGINLASALRALAATGANSSAQPNSGGAKEAT